MENEAPVLSLICFKFSVEIDSKTTFGTKDQKPDNAEHGLIKFRESIAPQKKYNR
jgi:hypothetical protein